MMTMMKRMMTFLFVAAAAQVGGCSLSTPFPDRALFTLNTDLPEASATQSAKENSSPITLLRVRRIIAVPPYGGTEFVYRTGPQRLETDYYNAFAAAPAELVTAQLVQWLRRTGDYKAVLDGNGGMSAGWALEGRLQDLAIDTTDAGGPQAVLTLEFVLLDESEATPRPLLERTYTEKVRITGAGGQAAAAGWSLACTQVFKRLNSDLEQINH